MKSFSLFILLNIFGVRAILAQEGNDSSIHVTYYHFHSLDSILSLCRYQDSTWYSVQFKLFNRWGEKVAQATSLCFVLRDSLTISEDSIWEGTYFYQVKYKIPGSGKKYEVFSGSIMILIDEAEERRRARGKSRKPESTGGRKGN